jgi:hypothetical protein
VTALHNHGLYDTPRLFYMHFWAVDEPTKLAQDLKAADTFRTAYRPKGAFDEVGHP